MRKSMLLGAVSALVLNAGAANAVSPTDSVDIPLSGTLPKSCDISAFVNGPFDDLDMESTEIQGAESVTVNCNYGGTASVELASANSGFLEDADSNQVGYNVQISGGLLALTQLTTPQTINNWPAVAFADQTRSISVQLLAAATIPGTYTDTITASVTPN
ncbi:MAG: hypothetical protein ACLFWF_06155 [Alphaproteobacteria bacterium]